MCKYRYRYTHIYSKISNLLMANQDTGLKGVNEVARVGEDDAFVSLYIYVYINICICLYTYTNIYRQTSIHIHIYVQDI